MIYNFNFTVDCLETRKNYDFCPDSLHTHKLNFSIGIEPSSVENEEEFYYSLKDSISPSTYIENKWSLKLLAETMLSELLQQGFNVCRVKIGMSELPLSFEVTNV